MTLRKTGITKPLNGSGFESITVQLNVSIFKIDTGHFFAYCPALNLSSYGDSQKDARDAFSEALHLFIEETIRMNTFEKELLKQGWVLAYKPKPFFKLRLM
jgi:predicted RNase H-like HicB family nuclease